MHLKNFIGKFSGRHSVTALLAAILCSGCLYHTASDLKQKAGPDQSDKVTTQRANVQDSSGISKSGLPNTRKATELAGYRPEAWQVSHKIGGKIKAAELERAKAKDIALGMARNATSVNKIKICHDPKESEWWIILYEDRGIFVELKQYTWNIYKDTAQPFLVQERVSKDRLADHLAASKSSGMSCEVLERSETTPCLAEIEPNPAKSVLQAKLKSEAEPQSETVSASHAAEKPKPPVRSKILRSKAHVVEEPPAPPNKLRKSPTSAALTRDGDERVYQLTTSDPIRPKQPILQSDAVKPDFRPASADPTTLDVAPKRAVSATAALSPVDKGSAAESGRRSNLRDRETSKPAQSRPELPTYFVFIYGAEMNHPQLMAWLEANGYDPSLIVEATPAILEGYDFIWNYYSESRQGGSVNLQPKKNSKIWGLLVECEDRLLEAFDHKEGHPNYYDRGEKRVPVRDIGSGRTVFAWLYLARPNKGDRRDIWPTRDYKSRVLEAALFWDFPEDYIRKIRDWPTR